MKVKSNLAGLFGQITISGFKGSSEELIQELKANTRIFSQATMSPNSSGGHNIKLHSPAKKPGSLKIKKIILSDLGKNKVIEIVYKKRNRFIWNWFIFILAIFTFVLGAIIVWLIWRDKPHQLESMARISFGSIESEIEAALVED